MINTLINYSIKTGFITQILQAKSVMKTIGFLTRLKVKELDLIDNKPMAQYFSEKITSHNQEIFRTNKDFLDDLIDLFQRDLERRKDKDKSRSTKTLRAVEVFKQKLDKRLSEKYSEMLCLNSSFDNQDHRKLDLMVRRTFNQFFGDKQNLPHHPPPPRDPGLFTKKPFDSTERGTQHPFDLLEKKAKGVQVATKEAQEAHFKLLNKTDIFYPKLKPIRSGITETELSLKIPALIINKNYLKAKKKEWYNIISTAKSRGVQLIIGAQIRELKKKLPEISKSLKHYDKYGVVVEDPKIAKFCQERLNKRFVGFLHSVRHIETEKIDFVRIALNLDKQIVAMQEQDPPENGIKRLDNVEFFDQFRPKGELTRKLNKESRRFEGFHYKLKPVSKFSKFKNRRFGYLGGSNSLLSSSNNGMRHLLEHPLFHF